VPLPVAGAARFFFRSVTDRRAMGPHDIAPRSREDASARCPAFGCDGHIINDWR
jgi:hypothetical protein